MKSWNVVLRILCACVALSLVQILAGALLTLLFPLKTAIPTLAQHFALWMFFSNAVTAIALSIVALRAEWRGWTLGAAVAAIPLVITVVDGIEGIYFLPNSPIPWPRVFAQSALTAAFSIPVWTLLFGRRAAVAEERFHPIAAKSRAERAWKFVVCDLAYLVLYFIAGSMIWPYIKDFYATQKLPSFPGILAMELLVRGPAFMLLCVLLVRMMTMMTHTVTTTGLTRLTVALAVGAVFALLSGVAPLLIPTPYFPEAVRWMHFREVSSSNFVFGAIVAWLWGQPKLEKIRALRQAA
jgi:hypothetical protein